jgi:hypothetical protein
VVYEGGYPDQLAAEMIGESGVVAEHFTADHQEESAP